jgi:hypothetical protein
MTHKPRLWLAAVTSIVSVVLASPVGATGQEKAHAFGNPAVWRWAPSRSYHVEYKLTLHFDEPKGEVFGDDVVTLRPFAAHFQNFYLDSSELQIDSVTLEPPGRSPVKLAYSAQDPRLWITLDRATTQPARRVCASCTTLEALYTRHHEGYDAYRFAMYNDQLSEQEEDRDAYRRPIVDRHYNDPLDMFDATTHEKGAAMLDMLRYIVDGAEASSHPASQDERLSQALHGLAVATVLVLRRIQPQLPRPFCVPGYP